MATANNDNQLDMFGAQVQEQDTGFAGAQPVPATPVPTPLDMPQPDAQDAEKAPALEKTQETSPPPKAKKPKKKTKKEIQQEKYEAAMRAAGNLPPLKEEKAEDTNEPIKSSSGRDRKDTQPDTGGEPRAEPRVDDLFGSMYFTSPIPDRGDGASATGEEPAAAGLSGTIQTSGNVEPGSLGDNFGAVLGKHDGDAGVITENTGHAPDAGTAFANSAPDVKEESKAKGAPDVEAAFDLFSAPASQAQEGLQPSLNAGKDDKKSANDKKERPPNFKYADDFKIGEGGAKTKAKNNIAAIRTVKALLEEGRDASDEERQVLAKFVGWGGIPQIFDKDKKDWASLYKELEELLDKDEYETAKGSTINAHYTDRDIVEAMWEGVQGLGFSGGKVIEPGMGVGYFMGLSPDEVRGDVQLTGIELDKMTGQIARALYPQADIKIEGFQKTRMPFNSIDMAIGNVPFGNITLRDQVHNRGRHSIHDHFINKSLDLMKPGGLASFVTSRYSLDKMNPAARKELAKKADLIGAIRLPSDTFAGNAGTAVVTDILVFRKRKEGEEPIEQEWVKTGKYEFEQDGEHKEARINQYYIDNPDMMLGQVQFGRGMYKDDELRWIGDDSVPIRTQVDLAFQKIIERAQENGLMHAPEDLPENDRRVEQSLIAGDENREEWSLYEAKNGDIIQYANGEHVVYMECKTAKSKNDQSAELRDYRVLRWLLELRDLSKDVLRLQMQDWDGEGEEPWATAQRRLNTKYNMFEQKYGPINSISKRLVGTDEQGNEKYSYTRKYLKLMKDDPDVNFVRALEVFNPATEKAAKSDIFTSRVVSPDREITGVENVLDGFLASLNTQGKVDIDYIADLMGVDHQEVIDELGDKIYRNPQTEEWESENEYLSGNVREKLEAAEKAAQENPEYFRNAAALEGVIPEDLAPQDIAVSFGAPWIPTDVIEQFIHETLEIDDVHRENISVEFYPEQALWRVKGKSYHYTGNPKTTNEWGTDRKPMLEIISDMLNQKNITIYDTYKEDGKEKKVKNIQETLAANEKKQMLNSRFREWIWQNEERADRLGRIYNDRYNNIVLRQYDGSHLSLPGMNENIKLRDHQKNVIWRILQSGNTLMGHAVGAGKTLAAIGASMEEKRLGLTNKPLHVIPNHMLEQYASDFQKAYPDAKVLVADKDDFSGDKRRHFVAQCATGNWDAVIMTHSSFGKIAVSPEREARFLEQRIEEYTSMIEKAKADGDKFTVKMFEKMKKTREEKIERLMKSDEKDKGITFEQMGIDRIYCDEAHLFKNLEFTTRTQGVSQSASQRATDMFMKIGYLEELNPGRSAVFMTGTPIANSVAEAFTMMRYLYLDKMKEKAIDNFDSWIAMFGEFVTALELAPDGGSYRMHSRLAKFCNVPELKQMFLEFADILTKDMLDLPTPTLKGGKHTIVTVPASDELRDYIAELVARAERVKNREVEPHEDNMLKITSDGRKAALDLREKGIEVADKDQEGLKLRYAADNIAKRYHANKDKEFTGEDGEPDFIVGALQSVFCDLSTPGKGKDFSAYEKLKEYLIERGVPTEAIRFIHEANSDKKKEQLFEDCRNGKVSIIMGSTEKMGFGTNIQKRMVAQHHLDAPWRPADIEQRDGRIERQGNQNDEIEILRYVTEGSFDVYMWQALERKAKFISQIMSPFEAVMRSFEDNDVKSLSYAEVKAIATGDTRLIEQAEVEAKIANLHMARETHNRKGWKNRQDINGHKAMIELHTAKIANTEETLKIMTPDVLFNMADGLQTIDAKDAGAGMMKQIRLQFTQSNLQMEGYKSQILGEVHGFQFFVETGGRLGNKNVRITVNSPQPIEFNYDEEKIKNMRADTILNHIVGEFAKLPERIEESRERIAEFESLIEQKTGYLGKSFDREEEYQTLLKRQKELEEMLRPSADETALADQIDVEEEIGNNADINPDEDLDDIDNYVPD